MTRRKARIALIAFDDDGAVEVRGCTAKFQLSEVPPHSFSRNLAVEPVVH
jgi:hypothetical protein